MQGRALLHPDEIRGCNGVQGAILDVANNRSEAADTGRSVRPNLDEVSGLVGSWLIGVALLRLRVFVL